MFFVFFNLPMCTPWRDSVYAATPLQIMGSKTHQVKTNVGKPDIPEKVTSTFTEASIRYSECC
jgi:hypothetical protein